MENAESALKVEVVQLPEEPCIEKEKDDMKIITKVAIAVLAVILAFFSFTGFADYMSSPDNYKETIAVLDEKMANAAALTTASAAASAAISIAPGDWGGALSEELAGLSSDLSIVTMAILLEKYSIVVFGLLSFKLLIPVACAAVLVGAFCGRLRWSLFVTAGRIIMLAAVLCAIVPASAKLSSIIDETYDTVATMRIATEQADGESQAVVEDGSSEGEASFFDRFKNGLSGTGRAVADAAGDAVGKAQTALYNLLEAFAVMVITTCVIPIIVLLVALWSVNILFKVDVSKPMGSLRGRSWRKSALSFRKHLTEKPE